MQAQSFSPSFPFRPLNVQNTSSSPVAPASPSPFLVDFRGLSSEIDPAREGRVESGSEPHRDIKGTCTYVWKSKPVIGHIRSLKGSNPFIFELIRWYTDLENLEEKRVTNIALTEHQIDCGWGLPAIFRPLRSISRRYGDGCPSRAERIPR